MTIIKIMIWMIILMMIKMSKVYFHHNHYSWHFDCMKATTWGSKCQKSDLQRWSAASVLHRQICAGFCCHQVCDLRAAPISSLLSLRPPRRKSSRHCHRSCRSPLWLLPRWWCPARTSHLDQHHSHHTAARESKCLSILTRKDQKTFESHLVRILQGQTSVSLLMLMGVMLAPSSAAFLSLQTFCSLGWQNQI